MNNRLILVLVAGSAAAGGAGGYLAAIPAGRENTDRIQHILTDLERQKSAAEPEKIPRTSFKINLPARDPLKGGDSEAAKTSAADFLDHPKTYTGRELSFYMIADDAYLRDMTLRDILKASPRFPMIFHLDGYKVAGKIALEFPAGLDLPATAIDERILVRFQCTQGRTDSGNVVVSVERIEK